MTDLTATSINLAFWRQWIGEVNTLIVGGGGAKNELLMRMLAIDGRRQIARHENSESPMTQRRQLRSPPRLRNAPRTPVQCPRRNGGLKAGCARLHYAAAGLISNAEDAAAVFAKLNSICVFDAADEVGGKIGVAGFAEVALNLCDADSLLCGSHGVVSFEERGGNRLDSALPVWR